MATILILHDKYSQLLFDESLWDFHEGDASPVTDLQRVFCKTVPDQDYERSLTKWKADGAVPSERPRRSIPYVDADGVFRSGLAREVMNYVQRLYGVKVEIEDNRTLKAKDMKTKEQADAAIARLPFSPRHYQRKAVELACRRTRGIFEIGTGGGKTAVMAAVIAMWDVVTLIPVKSKDLAIQLRQEISDYLDIPIEDIGLQVSGRKRTIGPKITVGVVNGLSKKKYKSYLDTVEMLIVDECHNGTSSYYDDLMAMTNPKLTYGFSATPYPRAQKVNGEDVVDMLDIVGRFGRIIFSMPVQTMIEEGWLSEPEVWTVPMVHDLPEDYEYSSKYQKEYDRFILENKERNDLVEALIRDCYDKGGRTIVFVTRISHGIELFQRLVDSGIDSEEVGFANGQAAVMSRKKALEGFSDGSIKILIGTDQILSEGLNFLIDYGVIAGAGKSNRGIIQKIGRILRKPRSGKGDVDTSAERYVRLFDIHDIGHAFFASQSMRRQEELVMRGFDVKTATLKRIKEMKHVV